MTSFVYPAQRSQLRAFIESQRGKRLKITVAEYQPTRSLEANAFYWAAVVTPLARKLGYTPKEMHEVLLAEVNGTKVIEFNGHRREVPRRRSRDMNVQEFTDYVTHCQRIAAEYGVVTGSRTAI